MAWFVLRTSANNLEKSFHENRDFYNFSFIVAFISPFKNDRLFARNLHLVADLKFYEIYVDTPLDICKQRDPKGLYDRALKGEIKGLSGLDAPYEVPDNPEFWINTLNLNPEQASQIVLNKVQYNIETVKETSSSSEDEQKSKPTKRKQHKKNKNRRKKDRR